MNKIVDAVARSGRTGSKPPGYVFGALLLTLALLCVFPLFAWYGYAIHGAEGIRAAGAAAGLCWVGSMVALVTSVLMRGPENAVNALLLGTMFRMGVPLFGGLALHKLGGELAAAGVFGMTLCYYFVTLAVEIPLSLRFVQSVERVSEVR